MAADIKSIIREQRQDLERIEKADKIIKRFGLEKARSFLKYPNILAITGIRRCGKSIFSYLLEKDSKFGYINFDDERLAELKANELNKIMEAFYELYGDIDYVILDEVQNIHGWELFANRLRRTKKVIVTGSNSNLLSGELATHLTGRYIDIMLFPFSFKEFLDFKSFKTERAYTSEEKSQIINYLNEYLENGGLPEVYKFGKIISSKICEDIITKDIILRHKIKKIDELKKLARYLISNSTETTTYIRLSNILGIKNITTISNWISYLEEAFLIFKLEKFDYKLKQQFIAPKKIFCIDTGMVDSIGFKFSENRGKILENAVAIELQRKEHTNEKLKTFYWRDYNQNEVDFAIKQDKKIVQLIQANNISSKEDLKEREVKSLLKASDELKCKNLLIITWDYEGEQKVKNKTISFIPLWKWLLE